MPLRVRNTPYPRYSQYQRYKGRLRLDFDYRCAYCGIHEAEWGGHRHFQVEHLRPRKLFPWLQAEYTNLLYACDVCNCHKGCDWPTDDPTPNTRGYLDPCQYDLDKFFAVRQDGTVEAQGEAARYMAEALYLNRPQLKELRVKRRLEEELHARFLQLFAEVEAKAAALRDESARERVLRKLIVQLIAVYRQHLQNIWENRSKPPYELYDV